MSNFWREIGTSEGEVMGIYDKAVENLSTRDEPYLSETKAIQLIQWLVEVQTDVRPIMSRPKILIPTICRGGLLCGYY